MRQLLLILALSVLGCGSNDSPPSQLQACKAFCSKQKACNPGVYTDADVQSCQLTCDSQKSQYDANDQAIRNACKNADDILRTIYNCYAQDCDQNQAQTCATNAGNSCTPK